MIMKKLEATAWAKYRLDKISKQCRQLHQTIAQDNFSGWTNELIGMGQDLMDMAIVLEATAKQVRLHPESTLDKTSGQFTVCSEKANKVIQMLKQASPRGA